MSAINYVTFLKQKYTTAAAIYILKNKPKNVDRRTYVLNVQEKFRRQTDSPPIDIDELPINEHIHKTSNCEVFDKAEFSQIFSNDVCDEAMQEETTQIFQNIRTLTDSNIKCSNSSSQGLNFELISAINNVKSTLSYNERRMLENVYGFKRADTIVSTCETQESGYQSATQFHNNNKESDFKFRQRIMKQSNLNKSIMILIDFMLNAGNKIDQNDLIVAYVTDIVMKIFDKPYDQNISLPAFEFLMNNIYTLMEEIFNNYDEIINKQTTINMFLSCNKSCIVVEYTMPKLLKRLKTFLSKISSLQYNEALEVIDLNCVDDSYFIMYLINGLIKNYKERTKKLEEMGSLTQTHSIQSSAPFTQTQNGSQTQASRECSQANKNISDQLEFNDMCKKVLNPAVLECVDSYPLISFWAMECINELTSD